MANCTICGNDVSPITVGRQTDLCADCQYKTENAPSTLLPQIEVESSSKTFPAWFSVTRILVGLNIAVFAGMALTGVSVLEPKPADLVKWGADWGPLTLGSQPWRLLTSNYVHIGVIHLFFNMWCLLNLGALAERLLDRKTYLLIYTMCGLAGSCVSLWWHPEVVGAGASGAIFGLAGALLAVLYLGKFPGSRDAIRPTLKSLLSFAGWNLFFGLRAGVDNSAHVGGLVAGLAMGAIFSRLLRSPEDQRSGVRNLVALGGALILLVAFIGTRREYQYPAHVAITPEDYFAAIHNALTALGKNDSQTAIVELRKVVAVNPRNAQAHYLLGSSYLTAHQPDAAMSEFQQALAIRPKYRDAEIGLSMAYSAKGMRREAQSLLDRSSK